MRWMLGTLLALAACEPPPEPAGGNVDPSLAILYPPKDIGCWPEQLDAPDTYEILFVVDIDNLDVIPPATATGDVPTEGHWHLQESGGSNVNMIDGISFVNEIPADPVRTGQTILFEAFLVSNLHRPLEEFEDFEDVVEITLGCE